MNLFRKIYCRAYQAALKIALPFLPYRDPEIIDWAGDIPEVLKKNGKNHPLIVTGKTVRGLGLIATLENALKENNIGFSVFDGTVANPTADNVYAALEVYRSEGCDCLIGFGGGSPIDCAKCVGALIARPEKTLQRLGGVLKVKKKIPLLIAVPTTAGTGSETTPAAVIVDSATRRKYAISDFPLIPSYAVLDGSLCSTLPKSVIATTGMDALTHAVEAFIGRGGNRSSRRDALEACRLIFGNLENSYNGDSASAQNMLIASHKAGRAFSRAYVGYVHALAHALGGKYNVSHGLANAVILPVVLREYGSAVHRKLSKLAVYCGLADKKETPAQGAEVFIRSIEQLNEKFGIGKTIPQLREEDIEGLAHCADGEANPLYPVPVLWDGKKLAEIYRKLR